MGTGPYRYEVGQWQEPTSKSKKSNPFEDNTYSTSLYFLPTFEDCYRQYLHDAGRILKLLIHPMDIQGQAMAARLWVMAESDVIFGGTKLQEIEWNDLYLPNGTVMPGRFVERLGTWTAPEVKAEPKKRATLEIPRIPSIYQSLPTNYWGTTTTNTTGGWPWTTIPAPVGMSPTVVGLKIVNSDYSPLDCSYTFNFNDGGHLTVDSLSFDNSNFVGSEDAIIQLYLQSQAKGGDNAGTESPTSRLDGGSVLSDSQPTDQQAGDSSISSPTTD